MIKGSFPLCAGIQTTSTIHKKSYLTKMPYGYKQIIKKNTCLALQNLLLLIDKKAFIS